MTLFIIGGLLIIALLAILGSVFLSVSDQRATKAQANGSVSVGSPATLPLVESSSAANRASERIPSQNLTSTVERSANPLATDQQQYALNGQFHELTIELQTLYQHASELERRLRTLTDIADRIEKTQSNQISTEQQIHAPSSIDSNQ